jgi:hypothetical protein
VFGALRLRRAGSTAIDVRRAAGRGCGPEPRAAATHRTLGLAVSGALAGIAALADPELAIIGGPWGSHPPILDAISAAAQDLHLQVRVRAAALTTEPSLAGARADAIGRLRSGIVAAAHRGHTSPGSRRQIPGSDTTWLRLVINVLLTRSDKATYTIYLL